MKKVAELLKSEREKKGLSLHEIGLSLKINPKILSAIEEADLPKLPAKTFLRGFIRSYAQYLKLNAEQVMALYNEEMEPQKAAADKMVSEKASELSSSAPQALSGSVSATTTLRSAGDEPKFSQSSRGNRATLIIVSLILVFMIVVVSQLVEKYQNERRSTDREDETSALIASDNPEVLNPVVTEDALPSTTLLPTLGSLAASPAPHSASGTATSTSSTTATPVTTSTTTTTTTVAPTTTTTAQKPTTTTVRPTTTTTTAPRPTTTVRPTTTTLAKTPTTVISARPQEVILEALNSVTILINQGTEGSQSVQLSAGQLYTIRGKGKIDLEISDGGAVSVIVNGRERGIPGSIGKPIKLSY